MVLEKKDWIKKYIKLKMAFPNYRSVISELNCDGVGNRAVVIGAPIHSNLGDHLIAEECIVLVKKLGYEQVIEVPEFVYELFPHKVNIKSTDTIFIVGGGWMGDLYEDEIVVEELLDKYVDNKIVILPQTIHFANTVNATNLKRIIKKSNNVIICVREGNSLSVCTDVLELDKKICILLPDMALVGLDKIGAIYKRNTKRIIVSLREDDEKMKGLSDCNRIIEFLQSQGYECVNSSTVISSKIVNIKKRHNIIENKITEFSSADLIITDRLHSMVFALLAGTKVIAIDNLTHKVSGVYSAWLKEFSNVMVVEDTKNISENMIMEYLQCDTKFVKCCFNEEFKILKDKIIGNKYEED